MCFVQPITDINQYILYTSLFFDHKSIGCGKRSPGLKPGTWQCADWLVLSKTTGRNYISLSRRDGMIVSKAILKELLQKRLLSATWSIKNIGMKSPRTSPGSATRRQAASKRPNLGRASWIGWCGKLQPTSSEHTCAVELAKSRL
jgi:hypothetical protein